ncbi:carbohydrate ABC transporter ATP-binding protein (CUT1 family) [Haloactinopolyspora alba]|uniref:Carbohydrate ABC transporter ATP-binding protein (CUT1 family) n=1 Tax=Haloactinopolyspora alba TaxID=648780 RepID=A0A2P8E5K7_9ACTN|nr:ABC transporter ATP-binding protein [Haloactinopolyspora alba]PSL04755.1 carbohydrate ABC transporter ATP-binding protein (CUT1 family) [Haloactinopolyspora alba]
MATLDITGLSKRYGSTVGIDAVDLDIDDGEFFVLLGPSGAGKTTTLKSIAGLIEVDAGSVTIGGRDMSGVEPYERNVAMAFESYALYPQKSVLDNLASPLRSGRTGRYDDAEQRRRVDAVTGTLGISHLLDRLPKELSNGQRQRVALGRVLVRPADVYLLDEPLSHLDAKLRSAMRAELKQLGAVSQTTSVYVTHDYQEALALGDRVGVLRDGRIVQVGAPEQVWNAPADTFVAKAFGQPEITLLDAVVDDGRIHGADGAVDVAVPPGLAVTSGQRVRLGLRPRDVAVAGAGAPPDAAAVAGPDADPVAGPGAGRSAPGELRMRGRVGLVERLGRLVEVSVDVGGSTPVIVVTSAERAAGEGEPVELSVPNHQVHVFQAGASGEETPRIGSLAGATDEEDRA